MSNAILQFKVRGSDLYTVTFCGAGLEMQVFCTCPAGEYRGYFCKHAAAVLMGDITNMESGVECVDELRQRSIGSPLFTKALNHGIPAPPRPVLTGVESLEDVLAACADIIAAKSLEARIDGDEDRRILGAYRRTKRGRLKVQPEVALTWNKMVSGFVVQIDGSMEYKNLHPCARPWGVRGRNGNSRGAWAHLERAAFIFREELVKFC